MCLDAKNQLCIRFQVMVSFINWAATWQNQQNGFSPSENSEQPGHPRSLIRVFAVRMKKHWILSYPLSAWRSIGSLATHWAHSEDSDQTEWMPRLIWVFAGRTVILLVLSCRGSFLSFAFWFVFNSFPVLVKGVGQICIAANRLLFVTGELASRQHSASSESFYCVFNAAKMAVCHKFS